jgi:1-acyl-sn-glycerol-3-phosphate acyltransferase
MALITQSPNDRGAAIGRVGSWLRARWWGLAVAVLTDGLSTVTANGEVLALAERPRLPEGPLVVVANHRSHADSAALLATLGRDRPVRFVAAADYWEVSRLRRWAATALAGIWPVHRGGSGWEDLAAAADAVRAGVVLVVYPEGTRSRDGTLGEFRSGAFRLAALAGARVLPIAVAGTGHVLGVHGRLRRGPVELRWGPPLEVPPGEVDAVAAEARRHIALRLDRPAVARSGRAWARAARLASSPVGVALVGGWALAEGVSWPFLAEMPLILLAVAARRRAPLLVLAAVAGSIGGILVTWWLTAHGVDPPAPFTTPRMEATAAAQIAVDPTAAFLAQTVDGIPVKVYAAAAGHLHLSLADLLTAVWPRVARIAVLGSLACLAGSTLRRYLQPLLGVLQVAAIVAVPFVLAQVVALWR